MFMGIDVGSSGCKASVIGVDGKTLAFEASDCTPRIPRVTFLNLKDEKK